MILKPTGGKVETLLLKKLTPNTWQALTKPGIKVNQEIKIIKKPTLNISHPKDGRPLDEKNIQKPILNVSKNIIVKNGLLAKVIKINSDGSRMKKYQTIYAKKKGSFATSTAGFHFTRAWQKVRLNRTECQDPSDGSGRGSRKTPTFRRDLPF